MSHLLHPQASCGASQSQPGVAIVQTEVNFAPRVPKWFFSHPGGAASVTHPSRLLRNKGQLKPCRPCSVGVPPHISWHPTARPAGLGSPAEGHWFLGLFAPKPSPQCHVPHKGSTMGCTKVPPDSPRAPNPSSEHTYSPGPEWISQALPSG